MLLRRRPGEWGPVEWTVAVALSAVVLACGGYGGWALWPKKPPKCEPGLDYVKPECVGVTAEAFPVDDPAMEKLLQKIEEQNDWAVEQREEESTPYLRIALMMPFVGSDKSSMTALMARRAVAGALAAQQEVNKSPGPNYQMMLAPNGKDLDKWDKVTPRLSELAKDTEAPLVGVTGISSSTQNSLDAVEELDRLGIPTTSPVTTSTKMRADYLFKTPPSNEQFAEALHTYLRDASGGKDREKHGFLVWDDKRPDIYASDLKAIFQKRFREYGLADDNQAPYAGGSVEAAKDSGTNRIFDDAARRICGGDFDTVFFAGRDQDLPFLIDAIADRADCKDSRELRILKVGIGLESTLTAPETIEDLRTAKATVVNAASVSPLWWQKGSGKAPPGSPALPWRIEKLNGPGDLGDRPLDDGNAAMYYDAFKFLAETAGDVSHDIRKKSDSRLPKTDDVYRVLLTSPFNRQGCPDCFQGASGTYGFKSGAHDKWAVCKPVPVIEYRPDSSGNDHVSPADSRYRTYQHDGVDCPP